MLGPDGSGKSTLIANIKERFCGTVTSVEVFHWRPFLIAGTADVRPVTDPHGQHIRPPWLSWTKIPYYVLMYGLGYLVRVRPHLARSALVLFDRYYDDLLVDPSRYRYGGPMPLAWWARRIIPRPDLVLVLDVPEEELLRRKQEVSLDELRRQRAAYSRLGAAFPAGFLIDASLPADAVARCACDIIRARLRTHKRRPVSDAQDGDRPREISSAACSRGEETLAGAGEKGRVHARR